MGGDTVAERAVYLGPRMRRLRRDLGMTQTGMAADLGISASYVALIEGNQRPVTADLLLRVARTYSVDLSDLARDEGADYAARLQTTLRDPLFADIDLPALQSADVAANYPGLTEAFLRLHAAYQQEQLALADQRAGSAVPPDERLIQSPVLEVRQFLAARRNSFPPLDEAAEAIAATLADAGGLANHIAARHGLRVRYMPSAVRGGMVRLHDPHHRAILINDALDHPSRQFQLALQLAYLALQAPLAAALDGATFRSQDGRRLARRAVANHAAGAILMPFTAFSQAVEERHYDIEALARQFGVSFEQTAHRLTTLQRPGERHVPFFFLRLDAAGNVSKRLDGAGFPFGTHGGACPLWSVHHVFRTPGRIVTQWLELPDRQRFFSIACSVTAGGGGFDEPRVERAVALTCAAEHAGKLVYARDHGSARQPDATPIGITCALCQRDRCPARAVPPLGRQILPDDYHRRLAPFGFADN